MNAIFLDLLENVINTADFNISCLYYFKFDKRVQDILLQIRRKFAMGVFVELQDSIACILDVYSAVVYTQNWELYSWILANRVVSLLFIGPDLVFSNYKVSVK